MTSSPESWLVTGASGLFGHHMCSYLAHSGRTVVGLRYQHAIPVGHIEDIKIDLRDEDALASVIREHTPDVIVHAAGLTNVDACEKQEPEALHLHATVASNIAKMARDSNAQLVLVSTDHLSDGKGRYSKEDDVPNPINAYARTKRAGEETVLGEMPEALVIRTNFFGLGTPWRRSFSDWIVEELSAGRSIKGFTDAYFTTIDLPGLSSLMSDLIARNASGIFNVVGRERVSKHSFAVRLAKKCGLDGSLVEPGLLSEAEFAAPRPPDMSLSVEKVEAYLGQKMPTLDECFANHCSRSNAALRQFS